MVPMIRWEEEERESWSRAAAAFPGVETRKVNMRKYNGEVEEGGGKDGEGATRWRQLIFYRIILDDDDSESAAAGRRAAEPVDLNLHAAAHLYASDRNSLFLIQHAAGFQKVRTGMASLSHTVIFHQPADSLCMVDDQGKAQMVRAGVLDDFQRGQKRLSQLLSVGLRKRSSSRHHHTRWDDTVPSQH